MSFERSTALIYITTDDSDISHDQTAY